MNFSSSSCDSLEKLKTRLLTAERLSRERIEVRSSCSLARWSRSSCFSSDFWFASSSSLAALSSALWSALGSELSPARASFPGRALFLPYGLVSPL